MIDWVTCRVPVTLPAPVHGGQTVILNLDGDVVKIVPHRLSVEGSFSSSLAIRAPSTTYLEISGNPLKWLQGHNLYGTDDLAALLWATLQRLEPHLPASLADIGLIGPESLSETILTRVDVTAMFTLPTGPDVLSWLRAAAATGSCAHRGRGIMRGETLVYGDARGKSFARWQIVLYSKGQEITAHPLPLMMMEDGEVLEWTNRCLRAEVRLGRLELQKKGLRLLRGWTSATAGQVWSEKLDRLDFNSVADATAMIEKLPQKLRPVYRNWTTGADLRQDYAKATFYRLRRQLLDVAGVDIAIPAPAVPTAEIIPLKRTLEAVPAGRPAWADRVDRQLRDEGAFVFGTAA